MFKSLEAGAALRRRRLPTADGQRDRGPWPPRGDVQAERCAILLRALTKRLAERDAWAGCHRLGIIPGVADASQLAATALWTQTVTNTGTADITLSGSLHIPAMEIGWIGVPAKRTSPSNTETALAQVDLAVSISRADGTLEPGGDFTFGMKISGKQFPLGTSPNVTTFSNFAVVDPFSSGKLAINPFPTLRDNGDDSVPKITIDISFTQLPGTPHPGDILSYVYTLTAEGTTAPSKGFSPSSAIRSISPRAAAVSR